MLNSIDKCFYFYLIQRHHCLVNNDLRYILSVDQGTTGTRAFIIGEDGSPVPKGYYYMEHSQIYPKPSWVEHDPMEIWLNTLTVASRAVMNAGINPRDIAAMAVTNQRETIVVWDPRTGQPLYNAIVWQDRRTSSLVEQLRPYTYVISEKTGLVPDPYFSGTKIWWLLQNIEGLKDKMARGEAVVGTIDSWLIWKLTQGSREVATPERRGAHVTDYSNASRTMLFNIHRLDWDEELLELMGGIPREALPLPLPSIQAECYGYLGPQASRVIGAELPVCAAAGDQQAALFGQACFREGMLKSTYGTGNFLLMNTGSTVARSKHGLLGTIFYSDKPKTAVYALEGSIFITGAAIKWLRDGLKIIEVSSEVNPLAESAESNQGVYFVPAFTGLGAPYWDQYARGLIIGITASTQRKHIARAVLEAIAYLNRDVIEAMKLDSGLSIDELRVDGGASQSDFLMQFQADVLGSRVVRPLIKETTVLGAAYMAGIAVGVWRGTGEVEKLWKAERVFEPRMTIEEREKLYSGWKEAVRRAMGWAYL
jgi:glycerol kinase